MRRLILFSILLIVSFSCKKFILETVTRPFANVIWEDRAEGLICEPSASPMTIDNGELTFSEDHMLCVKITMNESDFDVMRNESRFGPSIQEKDGVSAIAAAFENLGKCDVPFPSYYNWYTADVQVDGESLSQVGIRKKGFVGSIFSIAPSMKIRTDYYVSGQSMGTTENITLQNNAEDPSRLMHCLNYRLFEMADYPAPRTNLANVSVNDEPLGVYTHLEAIDNDFLNRNFGNHSGDLYEGQLVDFRADWITRWEVKNDQSDQSKGPLMDISLVLETASDQNLIAELEPHLNIDRYLTFWAMEVLLRHSDGYSSNRNNFLIYFDPADAGRATFIPWGLNYFRVDGEESIEQYLGAELPRRLSRIPEVNEQMLQRLQYILEEVWNESILLGWVESFRLQVETGEVNPNYELFVQEVTDWVQGRKSEVEQLIANGLPEGKSEPVKSCYGED